MIRSKFTLEFHCIIGLGYEWLTVIALGVFEVFIPLTATLVETSRYSCIWLISKGQNLLAGKALAIMWKNMPSKEQMALEQQLATENKFSYHLFLSLSVTISFSLISFSFSFLFFIQLYSFLDFTICNTVLW